MAARSLATVRATRSLAGFEAARNTMHCLRLFNARVAMQNYTLDLYTGRIRSVRPLPMSGKRPPPTFEPLTAPFGRLAAGRPTRRAADKSRATCKVCARVRNEIIIAFDVMDFGFYAAKLIPVSVRASVCSVCSAHCPRRFARLARASGVAFASSCDCAPPLAAEATSGRRKAFK